MIIAQKYIYYIVSEYSKQAICRAEWINRLVTGNLQQKLCQTTNVTHSNRSNGTK